MNSPKITVAIEPWKPDAEVYEISLNELEREQHRRALSEDGAEFWEDGKGKVFYRKGEEDWKLLE